ncbi:dimethyl sulfoxide reductase anchor subunit family protein [Aestuariivirga litoralis]|uniref:dimethyl sulfoxide reductase anchor subunit family protein n=1 Tax=Aestuariivirga litoralis TaxID=2650924 RepID=UPI0018C6F115|nr:DmsC/YnfH family molybdoenzyme membrane anchor subunit [Aestuariivirga litoralis]MBG1232608.1 dimethyl sulfoxide reductase anchor subunit [Aestuariivirga litoralis]
MNPAYSVIFFTVSSGAGYGLLALAGLVGNAHGKASSPGFAITTMVLALVLITAGLLSSTAHLGRPERAWRAFSQWRSSWLSREGVASVVTYPIAIAFGAVWSGLIDVPQLIGPLGIATSLMCAVTVVCTAMIYASLKTIPAWYSRFTLPTYLAFALATGSALLSVVSVIFGRFQAGAANFQALLSVILIFIVIVLKWLYWRHRRRARREFSMGQATGLGEGVRQWEVPHTASNFIMKEMGFAVARKHARRLQFLCTLLLDIAFFLTLFSPKVPYLVMLVAPLLLLAAWVERWLFFAEAEHVSALFYGKPAV